MLSVLATRRAWEGSIKSIKRRLTCLYSCDNSNELADLIDSVRSINARTKKLGIYSFFDIDETLLKRDTCLVEGFKLVDALIDQLKGTLGGNHPDFLKVTKEIEENFYASPHLLVDPLLNQILHYCKLKGDNIYALTSNSPNTPHTRENLKTLAKYRVTFSRPPVWGELPGTGAIVMDHAVLGGAIFVDNGQARKRDKGEVIVDFMQYFNHECHGDEKEWGDTRIQCILVDNTKRKCESAAETFLKVGNNDMDLHCIHYTEAENGLSPQKVEAEFRSLLRRLDVDIPETLLKYENSR